MSRTITVPVTVCLGLVWILGAPLAAQSDDQFETKVRPIFAAQCYPCHSAKAGKPQGGLRLDSSQGIKQGGNSGPLKDILLRAISYRDKDLKMPPGKPLGAEAITAIEDWVRSGARVPEDARSAQAGSKDAFWSFQVPKAQSPPVVQDTGWPKSDIDRFVLAKLEERGLRPSPPVDTRTLIRRVSYDLTGLAPTAEEIEAFAADKSPNAYERLVDRLLASPRYGERWGRH